MIDDDPPPFYGITEFPQMPLDGRYKHLKRETWQTLLTFSHHHIFKNSDHDGPMNFEFSHDDPLTGYKARVVCAMMGFLTAAALVVVNKSDGKQLARAALLTGLDSSKDTVALGSLELGHEREIQIQPFRPCAVICYDPATSLYARLVILAVAQTFFSQLGLTKIGGGQPKG